MPLVETGADVTATKSHNETNINITRVKLHNGQGTVKKQSFFKFNSLFYFFQIELQELLKSILMCIGIIFPILIRQLLGRF